MSENRAMGRLFIASCVAAAALAVAHAQQQPPAFGTTTRTVAVYATVTDPQGRLAPDLTRDNFEVDDNGVTQELPFSRTTSSRSPASCCSTAAAA